MTTILLIEDMDGVRTTVAMILSNAGYDVDSCEDGGQGLELAQHNEYDLIISDVLMPSVDGSEVIARVKAENPAQPILAISGGGGGVSAEDALRMATETADAILQKPFSRNQLLDAVAKLIKA